jgi:hypothetical protein
MQIFKHLSTAMAIYEFDDSNFILSFFKTPKKETLELLYKAEEMEVKLNEALNQKISEDPSVFTKKVEEFDYDKEK